MQLIYIVTKKTTATTAALVEDGAVIVVVLYRSDAVLDWFVVNNRHDRKTYITCRTGYIITVSVIHTWVYTRIESSDQATSVHCTSSQLLQQGTVILINKIYYNIFVVPATILKRISIEEFYEKAVMLEISSHIRLALGS